MPRKYLVINASVARASWGILNTTAPCLVRCPAHPVAKACREFLDEMRKICYGAVMTPEIAEEWDKHQNKFALSWRTNMKRHGKLSEPRYTQKDELRENIEKFAKTEQEREKMLKDVHLLEAALATDKIVISLDDEARRLYSKISADVDEIREITWRNPTDKDIISWLKRGATPDRKHWLGSTL